MGALFLATYGFIAGLVFSLVVLAAERTHTLHQLTLRRVAAWGGLGTVLMFAVPVAESTASVLVNGITLLAAGLLGAGCAAASLAVARRGLPAPPAMRRVETSPDH